MDNEKYIFTSIVISILDLFKILTYYIDDKKILEIRNKNIIKLSDAVDYIKSEFEKKTNKH